MTTGLLVPLNAEGKPFRIFLSDFDPWEKRTENSSQKISALLKSDLETKKDFVVDLCHLPVEFQKASSKAKECFSSLNDPVDLALSLGEDQFRSKSSEESTAERQFTLEFFAWNPKMEKGSREKWGFDLPLQVLYCSVHAFHRERIHLGTGMDLFVCNETAYELGHFFQEKRIPYGFIHVPRDDSHPSGLAPVTVAKLLASMLRSLKAYLSGAEDEVAHGVFPHPKNSKRLPTSATEVEEAMQRLKDGGAASSCESDFLTRALKQFRAYH